MKALVKAKAEPGLWLEERPVPSVGPFDALVKVHKTGICGTDIHIYNWDEWAQRTIPVPLVVGHEYSGEIAELGANVKGLSVGQRVSGEGHVTGTHSRAARGGRFHMDPETKGIGVNIPGAFAEYLALPAFNIVPLPDDVDDEMGAILDPLGNAVHTALAFDLAGEDVLITGAGPIGIMAGAVARHVGARHVVITDINPLRLKLATEVADVTPVDAAKEDLADVMTRLGMKEGFDIGLEMSGSPQAFEVDGRSHGDGRPHRDARHPRAAGAGRLDQDRVQAVDDQGHLWPPDVRDLAQDDRDAAERPRRPQGDHASAARAGFSAGLRDHALRAVRQDRAGLGAGMNSSTDSSDALEQWVAERRRAHS